MDLLSEEKKEQENKGRKIVITALIASVVLIILVLVLILVLQQQENVRMKLMVNGKSTAFGPSFTITDENQGINFFSIRQVAGLTGYNFFNGEYKKYSEDKTKCYVECKDELAMLELNSNILYKNNPINKQNFDAYTVDKSVISRDGELYATAQTIQTAFNTRVTYDKATNTIYLETLPYLVEYYTGVVTRYNYTGISEDFANQKALTGRMLIVNKDEKYGVISTDDFSSIIGNKYDKIVYLESTQEFIVTSEGKTGLLSIDGETKINLRYEDVGIIDSMLGLYYTKSNNLYGIVNSKGKVLCYNEYEDIGVDRSTFDLGAMKSNYILYDNCILLKKDGKWGMADRVGDITVSFMYDDIGYIGENDYTSNLPRTPMPNSTQGTAQNENNINNVVVIPSIEGIVYKLGDKYGVVNINGEVIIPFKNDKIFSVTSEGIDEYFLERSGEVMSLTAYLEKRKNRVENNNNESNEDDLPTPTAANSTPTPTPIDITDKKNETDENVVVIL